MKLHDRYETSLVAWREARSAMLSDRLTLSRKQAQMHEADVEQDDNVAEYFADRVAEMRGRVAADEEKVAALATTAEEVRIAMVTDELDATITSYNDALRAIAAQLAEMENHIAQLRELSAHAEALASTLPESATMHHQTAEVVANRTTELSAYLRGLQAMLSAPVPPR